MGIKEPPPKLSKKQKDLPRYKTTIQYEKALKSAYASSLGSALHEVVTKAKSFIKK